jgi:uncharacterized protein with PQ loop repeat
MRGRLRRARRLKRTKDRFEKTLVGVGLVTPTSAAPQLYNIWILKHTAGLSPVTTGVALMMSTMWTMYGLMEKRRAVWAVNGVWVFLNAVTLVGVMVNGS